MAKATTGRVEPMPEPDPDQMATDTLMTSVFAGISLLIATIILGLVGSAGLYMGESIGDSNGAKVGLGVGLVVGLLLIGWALRQNSERIQARSKNLYRGAWIGSIAAFVIIVLMAYAPQVAFPQYCPPGQICTNGRR